MGVAYGTYAFLHARLGAMKAELLTSRQWDQLLCADTYTEQQHQLESTSYEPWFQVTCEVALRNIRNSVYRTARKIERSVPSQPARFVHLWARRDLLRNLKTILKGKALARSEEEIRSELIELDPMYPLPTDSLLRCANLEATLDLLETTPLKHWIRAARRIYEQDPTLFGLDAALDRLYYPELLQQMGELGSVDRAAVKQMVSLEIDQVNLLWLLRYRLNYRLSPAETYYLLVPVTGHITADHLKRLVREESLEAIIACVEPAWLRSLQCESIWHVEVAMWRHRARVARQMLSKAAFTLGEALAILVLKVIEVRDLVALLEGSRLGVGREEIEKQLIGVHAE